MQIKLMRATPVVFTADEKTEITGVQRHLFRLLILREGFVVTNDEIASLHNTTISGTSSKIRNVRDQLGTANKGLIRNDRANGYSANLQGWEVDFQSFERTVRSLDATSERLLSHPITPEQALTEIKILKPAVEDQWQVNPAVGLYRKGEYELGLGLEAKFDILKQKADERLVMSQLYSCDDEHMREAIIKLRIKTKIRPEDAHWKLLLLAEHALGMSVATTSGEIEKHYKSNIPQWLRLMLYQISNHALPENPLLTYASEQRSTSAASTSNGPARGSTIPASSTSESETLIGLCKSLGISTHSNLRLTDSHLAPLSCIRRTRSCLDFSGVLASKWVVEAHVRAELDSLLDRLDRDNGAVRFLIINPNGSAFKRLSALRNGELSKESLVHLNDLIEKHKSFSVRVFDTLPAFRIVAIDNDVMSFSPYRLAATAYLASGRGWETPYIVLDQLAEYPLAEAFRLLFNENWARATPLEDLPLT